ncbi:MAG: protein kinase, partial [Chloroflexi bacterium]|nr:protein kinase [Chloroflexota bacterium]
MQAPQRLGRFENLSRIAEGGQATVFRARDSKSGETVAVKVLHAGPAFDLVHLERFRFEARIVAGISHPNVVRLIGGDLDGQTKYLAFEYINGSLKDALARNNGPLPPERAAWIAYQVAHGLDAAHATGVIHRDVKPSNILIVEDDTARLIDFGVARGVTAQTLTRTGAMVGTAGYMSPEQAEPDLLPDRSDLGPQSDIYSLGIVLYEMVVGRVPFTADSPVAIARMHVESPVPDVRAANPDVPEWLAEIIDRCLKKTPDERFESAVELAAALEVSLPELAERHAMLVQRDASDRTSTQSWDGAPDLFVGSRRRDRRRRWAWAAVSGLALTTAVAIAVAVVLLVVSVGSDDPGGGVTPPGDRIGAVPPPAEPPQVDTEPIQVQLVTREGQTTVAVLPAETAALVPIRRLEISADSTVLDGSLVIRGLASPLSEGVPELADSRVNRYLVMEVDGMEDASNLPSVVEFEVATAWLSAEGLTSDQIKLFRYVEQGDFREWVSLKTEVFATTTTTVRFSSELPGFSVFAVGSSTALLRPTPTPTQLPPTATPTVNP